VKTGGADWGEWMVRHDHTGIYDPARNDASQAYLERLYANDLIYASRPPSGRECGTYQSPGRAARSRTTTARVRWSYPHCLAATTTTGCRHRARRRAAGSPGFAASPGGADVGRDRSGWTRDNDGVYQ
jgi:hypothetical protein